MSISHFWEEFKITKNSSQKFSLWKRWSYTLIENAICKSQMLKFGSHFSKRPKPQKSLHHSRSLREPRDRSAWGLCRMLLTLEAGHSLKISLRLVFKRPSESNCVFWQSFCKSWSPSSITKPWPQNYSSQGSKLWGTLYYFCPATPGNSQKSHAIFLSPLNPQLKALFLWLNAWKISKTFRPWPWLWEIMISIGNPLRFSFIISLTSL